MATAAEVTALACKSTGHLRTELNLRAPALADISFQIEFFHDNAVGHIIASEYEYDRDALLKRDLAGNELKSFCGDLNALPGGWWRSDARNRQDQERSKRRY